jgi:4-amino-4-deoxy-L-arabinose transferase-like glycosyltransferase
VAVTSASQAGSIELATGLPVMAMGGFSGTDPAPTLAQFQLMVASGQVRFVIVGGRGGGSSTTSEIDNWVQANGTVVSSVSSSLYDLSGVAAVGA